jgi:hypothetical protein
MPDEVIWDGLEDGYLFFDPVEKEKAILKKLKAEKIPRDMVPWEDLKLIGERFIYQLKWPKDVAKLVFDNFWSKALSVVEDQYPDIRYLAFIETYMELAQAIDSIREDPDKTYSLLVFKELARAREKYNDQVVEDEDKGA